MSTSEQPTLARSEILLVVLVGTLLAVLMTWPLAMKMGSDIPQDLGDPLLQAWQVAWDGHALIDQPGDLFDANAFWPLKRSLAFSDALLGYAPAGLFGRGPHAAVVRYDLLFLFSYALAFTGAYLLAREMGVSRVAAVVGAVAYAFAPWKLAQNGHLNIISNGGIPLSLFLLMRGYRMRKPPILFAGWLVAIWQLSLGFGIGLQFAYLLGIFIIVGVWDALRSRWRWKDGVLGRTALVGATLFVVAGVLLAKPYLSVVDAHPEARRTIEEVDFYSPPLVGFIAAAENNVVWGERTSQFRNLLEWPPEQTLFFGVSAPLLALVGVSVRVYRPRVRALLLFGAMTSFVLALGTNFLGGGVYRLLYDWFPGWQGVRTPGRLVVMTSLFLSVLAAAGAHVASTAGRRVAGRPGAFVIASILAGTILVEGYGAVPHPSVPLGANDWTSLPSPQMHLPSDQLNDVAYMLWSTQGFPQLVNGSSGFVPQSLAILRDQTADFPDRASVELLRGLGVRTVILHEDRAIGTSWQDAASKPVARLGITRRTNGSTVIYDLIAPANAT